MLRLGTSDPERTLFRPGSLQVGDDSNSTNFSRITANSVTCGIYVRKGNTTMHLQVDSNNKVYFDATLSAWPTRSQVSVGQVFVGDDEIMRVRQD